VFSDQVFKWLKGQGIFVAAAAAVVEVEVVEEKEERGQKSTGLKKKLAVCEGQFHPLNSLIPPGFLSLIQYLYTNSNLYQTTFQTW
jgi:hypothetical protein